jgi:predicted dehydrogenase
MKTIKMIQVGHNSEWFLEKGFPALTEKKIERRFCLKKICGVYENQEIAREKIREAKKAIKTKIKTSYAARNILAQKRSLDIMARRLANGRIDYFHVNGNYALPISPDEENDQKVVYICSTNRTHLGYLIDAISHKNTHVLLEKPAIIVMNTEGNADDTQLKELEKIIESCPENIRLIDAEHYSHKKAATIFYNKLEEILAGEKIQRVDAILYEPDDPGKPRNRGLFKRANGTGLLTDTGVHLISFVSNLGAIAKPISGKIKYGMHGDYDVETSVNAEYTISNDEYKKSERAQYFAEDAKLTLNLEKFSKEKIGCEKPGQRTKKRVVITLEDNSKVVINLLTNRVFKLSSNGARQSYKLENPYSNEYTHVMQDAYETIINPKHKARSELRDSVKTMRAIYETYKFAPITEKENIEDRYTRGVLP